MISLDLANAVLLASLTISSGAYIYVSRCEGSYVNIMTPGFLVNIPAMYLLPIAFNSLFGPEASPFAYIYVYATIAAENLIFAFFYTRPKTKPLCLPLAFSYSNFWGLSLFCLAGAGLLYLPILLEFREYIFDPRRIYEQTRTGFGTSFFLSSTLVYLAVILAMFAKQSVRRRVFVFLAAGFLLSLHGSKGQVLQLFFLIVIFEIYVRRRKLTILPALAVCFGIGVVLLGLFAATMTLETPADALQSLSQYSDYTRNAMLVIDSNFPLQYGRLTWESNVLAPYPELSSRANQRTLAPSIWMRNSSLALWMKITGRRLSDPAYNMQTLVFLLSCILVCLPLFAVGWPRLDRSSETYLASCRLPDCRISRRCDHFPRWNGLAAS